MIFRRHLQIESCINTNSTEELYEGNITYVSPITHLFYRKLLVQLGVELLVISCQLIGVSTVSILQRVPLTPIACRILSYHLNRRLLTLSFPRLLSLLISLPSDFFRI